MARIRRTDERKKQEQIVWRVGRYIRLSREDGNDVSESVVNQDKILTEAIPKFFEDGMYEVVDTYIDDGTSGTTDLERADFQRMVRDVKSGRINCIIVKNLSRAFRNSANQGHFLEEFIPLYHIRFISLYQPVVDTFLDPEVVHGLEVSITGFMNEQYAYKTSVDVRRTFKYKMENGEFIGAFASYGYAKDPKNKNMLIIDEEAAQVVRDIFSWYVKDGMSKMGIARRLNELGIPNPTAYKRSKGLNYINPNTKNNSGLWSLKTISGILEDQIYIGTMRQGRQRVVSYKIHKRRAIAEDEWITVENAVTPLIDRETFEKALSLSKRDTRTAPGEKKLYLFSGFLRCADCKKAMTRRATRGFVYYACRTYKQQSTIKCTRHTIRADRLEQAVLVTVQKQIELVASLSDIIEEINNAPVVKNESNRMNALLNQKRAELEKASTLLDGLYFDWKSGEITHEQYRRMKPRLEEQTARLRKQLEHIEDECATMARSVHADDPYLTAFLKYRNIESLSRALLVDLVNVIYIHEDGTVEIEFNFADQYRRIVELMKNNRSDLCVVGGSAV